MIRVARAVFLVTIVACMPSARLPTVTTPQGNSFFGKGMVVGVGIELPPFGASYQRNGTRHDTTYGPKTKIPVLQMFSVGFRQSLTTNCDVGGQLGIGATGADIRCGIGDKDRTLAVATGATFKWWHGLVGRTEVQAGIHRDGFLAFASTGVTYSYFQHAIGLREDSPAEDVFVGPSEPYVRVRQVELAWSSSITLGLPPATGGEQPTIFLNVSVDKPLVTSASDFNCHGCSGAFSDFDPGIRIGGVIGVAATMD